jgi:D-glycero-D-manno-heptose 1,7-bisphosphate phosphatase
MILKAIEEFNIDPNESILIGDKATDIEAALRANIKWKILLDPENRENPENADLVIDDLNELTQLSK